MEAEVQKWIVVVALSLGIAACGGTKTPDGTATTDASGTTSGAAPAAAPAPASPQFAEVTIPSGTALRLELTSAVGSDTSTVEQPVTASLRDAVTVDGRVVLPAGSALTGVVTSVERSGRVKGRAAIAYRFNSVQANGESYDIATAAISHEAAATKGKDAEKIGIGAGAGAIIGGLLGGKGGALKGTAIGGAGGTGVVLATRGSEIHIGSGAGDTTRLTAPLTVRLPL